MPPCQTHRCITISILGERVSVNACPSIVTSLRIFYLRDKRAESDVHYGIDHYWNKEESGKIKDLQAALDIGIHPQ